ncbi:hypothetical protein GO755_14230 [Spirosoma sp. HMF4905]|uniref:PIN domain-containing protein n=1 Tax=Spirosoma arboris TaxID=2682092 RepID=A0A7K1SCB1_9BACT|nr:PIN domain-containing protein [Spirosoma arboris]MVM31196.1 hypothetical protein [Spirosoma arboris]
MKHIIVDTNILIRYPEILLNNNSEYKFYILPDVVKELTFSQKGLNPNIFNFLTLSITNAKEAGRVVIPELPEQIYNSQDLKALANYLKLSHADLRIFFYASYLKNEKKLDVSVVTLDKYLAETLAKEEISIMPVADLIIKENTIDETSETFQNLKEYSNITRNDILKILFLEFLGQYLEY